MNSEQFKFKWFVRGDVDGFFGLFVDILGQMIFIIAMFLYVFNMPPSLVFGRIFPAVALSILFGNAYFSWQAKKLGEKEGRQDVTAMPYGISTPSLFAFMFVIIGPVYWRTQDPMLAWRVGVACCFISGVIEAGMSLVGDKIRRVIPRAALLGSLAGVGLAFIALEPTFQLFSRADIGFIPLIIVLVGFGARVALPGRIPAGLVSIVIGTAIAWTFGRMDSAALLGSLSDIGFYYPTFAFAELFQGFADVLPYLAVVIPLALLNAIAAMQLVESAAAAGDKFSTRETMIANGVGSLVGAVLGSPFPTSCYIGHPGYKAIGARAGYSLLNGIVITVAILSGMLSVISNLIPAVAAFGILLYIGLAMTNQAFSESPTKHGLAVALALIPHLAATSMNMVSDAARVGGIDTNTAEGVSALMDAGISWNGLVALSSGSVLTSMLMAALFVFLIENDFRKAGLTSGIAAILSFFGFIHASTLGVFAAPPFVIGYLFTAVLCFALYAGDKSKGKIINYIEERY